VRAGAAIDVRDRRFCEPRQNVTSLRDINIVALD